MFEGQLIAIILGEHKANDLREVEEVEAVPQRGLVGDRYFLQEGTFTKPEGPSPDREVTLIESEALAALQQEYGVSLDARQARRNLVTSGVPLNHLVDRQFAIGEVVLQGIRLCEPCGHLEKLTLPGVRKGLIHRGGLRAQVIRGGILRVRDRIEPVRSTVG